MKVQTDRQRQFLDLESDGLTDRLALKAFGQVFHLLFLVLFFYYHCHLIIHYQKFTRRLFFEDFKPGFTPV